VNLRELVWPLLDEPAPTRAAQEAEQRHADFDVIKDAPLKPEHIEILIEEARRLTDAEAARRTSADTRATTYLAVMGVLAPILATLAPSAVGSKTSAVHSVVTLVLFAAAGLYLLRFGVWSFRVVQVSTGARVDAVDLIKVWEDKDPRIKLAKRLLFCVRWSRRAVNYKVSCIKMAHEYGLRALCVFVLAVIVRSAWDPVLELLRVIHLLR
jgi:hypothetical protein